MIPLEGISCGDSVFFSAFFIKLINRAFACREEKLAWGLPTDLGFLFVSYSLRNSSYLVEIQPHSASTSRQDSSVKVQIWTASLSACLRVGNSSWKLCPAHFADGPFLL